MSQTQRISRNNTAILREGKKVTVILHATPVVTIDYDARTVTFNTGGWETATTVTRMNQVCSEYHIPYRVSRAKGIMTVSRIPHDENVTFDFQGNSITLPL